MIALLCLLMGMAYIGCGIYFRSEYPKNESFYTNGQVWIAASVVINALG